MPSRVVSCPFCGGLEISKRHDDWGNYVMVCDTCGAQGPTSNEKGGSIQNALDAWNKRAGESWLAEKE